MHTRSQLTSDMFKVEVDGDERSVADLFAGWGPADRFGLVIDAPLGGVGANLLIQAAVVAFYDSRRALHDADAIYPEIYLFHLGQRHGDFSSFDAWPPYKEVLVEDPAELPQVLAERALTWLGLPDHWREATRSELTLEQEMVMAALRFRLRGGFAYGVTSRVAGHDVTISSLDPTTEENVRVALDPSKGISALEGGEYAYLIPLLQRRMSEVPQSTRDAIALTRQEDGRADGGSEFYRRLTPAELVAALPTPTRV